MATLENLAPCFLPIKSHVNRKSVLDEKSSHRPDDSQGDSTFDVSSNECERHPLPTVRSLQPLTIQGATFLSLPAFLVGLMS